MFTPPATAIFPVAGRGTRMLPATRAVPKELLPVLDRPILDFAIDEAIEAGIRRLIFVSHPAKEAIADHVNGRDDLPSDTECLVVMQPDQLGLGHAGLQARDLIRPGQVAVLLPDDLILGSPGALSEMGSVARHARQRHLVATMEVPEAQVSRYGILAPEGARQGALQPASGLIEKPDPALAPSSLAVVGRYLLDPGIFARLGNLGPGAGGEIQLTDAIAADAARAGLAGVAVTGRRFDCGSKPGYLQATLARASADPVYAALVPGGTPRWDAA
jgi:UTP--glucose-1-phosphate uridylyltransferase